MFVLEVTDGAFESFIQRHLMASFKEQVNYHFPAPLLLNRGDLMFLS